MAESFPKNDESEYQEISEDFKNIVQKQGNIEAHELFMTQYNARRVYHHETPGHTHNKVRALCFRRVLFFRHVLVMCFLACLHLTAQIWCTPLPCTRVRWLPSRRSFRKASSVNAGFPHKDLVATPALNDGALSTSQMIQLNGADKKGSTAHVVTGAVT